MFPSKISKFQIIPLGPDYQIIKKELHSNFMSSFFTFKFMHLDLENIKMT